MASSKQEQWFKEPTEEMIINLQSLQEISDDDKLMIKNEMGKKNIPTLIKFNLNAIKYKEFENEENFHLFDNEIRPSFKEPQMTLSYKVDSMGIFNGKMIKIKISDQFKNKYQNYDGLAQRQDIINEEIKLNISNNLSINNIYAIIDESIGNCVKFAESLATTYKQQSKNKSRNKSNNHFRGNHYLMAERFDSDLTDFGLNNYTKENGFSGFIYNELDSEFSGFNTNMNIVGGRFYQSGPHLENLDVDSYNNQTDGLKIWCVYHPQHIPELEKYIATDVVKAFYVEVKLYFILYDNEYNICIYIYSVKNLRLLKHVIDLLNALKIIKLIQDMFLLQQELNRLFLSQ